MSLRFFEGAAGSGKTTRLFADLAELLETRRLAEHEGVLALTKMHGSRRRMHGRFVTLPALRGRFECTTIDSLAWRVLRRWRSLARTRGATELVDDDYDGVCRHAGALLRETVVSRWMACSFPFLVIDEMQDSKDGQLQMVQALSQSVSCLAAADDYQDLDATGENAAVAWARQNGEIVRLTQNHRTSSRGLLAAAASLRSGHALPANGNGFVVLGARNHNAGASLVSRNLCWWGRVSDDIAIITPVRAETSPFIRNLIVRVEQGPIGNPSFGPYRVPWEVLQEDQCEQFLAALVLPPDPSVEVRPGDLTLPDGDGTSQALQMWFDQQRRLTGRMAFTANQIKHEARMIHRRSRAYRRVRDRGIRAMTIHQAKNREFDSVIVLWPYEVAGSAERRRRLLYNAITRAKRQALVIVQDPARLNRAPFVPEV